MSLPECVAHDPWKLLVAVMLLNKTAGRVALPVFWTLMTRWPTPESLAQGQLVYFSIPFSAHIQDGIAYCVIGFDS